MDRSKTVILMFEHKKKKNIKKIGKISCFLR